MAERTNKQAAPKVAGLKPEDNPTIEQLLAIEPDPERLERMRSLFTIDDPDAGPEVIDWLVKHEARFLNVVYNQLVGGVKIDEDQVDLLMRNAVDVHAHGGSDPFQRLQLEDEIGIEFTQAGFLGVVIKCWYTPSASRNALAQKAVDRYAERNGLRPAQVLGGVTLGYSVGGFNPDVVKKCLGFPGMRFVWFPMVDSYHHRRLVFDDWSGHGLKYTDERGRVIDSVKEILRIIAANDLVLATGHYSYEDSRILIETARELGVERISIVHPSMMHTRHTIEQMKEQAALGAKLELRTKGLVAVPNELDPLYTVKMIKEVGAEHFVLGSDWGQVDNLPQLLGNRWAIKRLLSFGIAPEEIAQIFKVQPAKLVGLESELADADVPAMPFAGRGTTSHLELRGDGGVTGVARPE
jgi:hypothetical protein